MWMPYPNGTIHDVQVVVPLCIIQYRWSPSVDLELQLLLIWPIWTLTRIQIFQICRRRRNLVRVVVRREDLRKGKEERWISPLPSDLLSIRSEYVPSRKGFIQLVTFSSPYRNVADPLQIHLTHSLTLIPSYLLQKKREGRVRLLHRVNSLLVATTTNQLHRHPDPLHFY